ncbi:MAG: hypothetical protein IJT98_07920 [Prevotella sp.]|nr:hypothetical protein [Prevotella sp.]
MNNPLKIFKLVFTARSPKNTTGIKAVKDGFWLGKSYDAMMFFGYIVTHTQKDADYFNSHDSSMKRHETIHLLQARSTHNSWLCFYILYIWYYARAIGLNRRHKGAAYRLNPFEMEAYGHMHDPKYIEKCQLGANEWQTYAKMKPKERLKMSKS